MKKLYLLLIAMSLAGCGQSSTPGAPKPGMAIAEEPALVFITGDARKSIVESETKHLSMTRDKMEGVSFYSPSDTNLLSTRLEAYISLPDATGPILRIMPVYYGDNWIFYDSIKVMADDQVVYEHIFPTDGVHHDNHGGSVWETGDYPAAEYDLSALKKIATAKTATIRFIGREHREDHDLTAKEFKNLKEEIEVFDSLMVKLKKPS